MVDTFNVLLRPHITEKTNYQNQSFHQYVFDVDSDATKVMIKDAVEKIFDVTVVRVNVVNTPAKRTKRGVRSRRLVVRRKGYKKAIVALAPGDTIQAFEGVK